MNTTVLNLREKYRSKAREMASYNVEASLRYQRAQKWLELNFPETIIMFEMRDELRLLMENGLMKHMQFGSGTMFANGVPVGEVRDLSVFLK